MKERVENFKKALILPREITIGKKTATTNLKRLFKDLENLYKDELDNLMANYEGTDFYNKYFDARILVDQIRHTVIKGNVVNPTGVDLNKVKVTITGREKETGNEVIVFEEMTNKDGNFVKSALNPELNYDVAFSLPNFEDKVITDIDLTRGTIDRLEVVLVPKT